MRDGTLTDPKVGIVSSIAHALKALGREGDSVEGFERYIGLAMLGRNIHVLGKLTISRRAEHSAAALCKRKAE